MRQDEPTRGGHFRNGRTWTLHPYRQRRLIATVAAIFILPALMATGGAVAAPVSTPEAIAQAGLSVEELALYELVQDHVFVESFAAIPWHMKKTLGAIATRVASGDFDGKKIPAYCFQGSVPIDVIGYLNTAYYGGDAAKFNEISSRWTTTATAGTGSSQGDPAVVTYSFVPDGTTIPADPTILDTVSGLPMVSAPNNLFAFLNGIYGSPAAWQAEFAQVFAEWSSLTGITYVFEPTDDGAAFPESGVSNGAPGVAGVRGDIRIAGIRIDGESGGNILAFNFFPNTGDMLIDTGNPLFYGNLSSDSLNLRNVVSHEHGHGLGMPHTCPVNSTKLMEPFISSAFDGVQEDDRLSGQRTYGDPNEKSGGNDTGGTATSLGTIADSTNGETNRSIDDNTDVDFYSFAITESSDVTVTLTPIGTTYLSDTQLGNGSCNPGVSFNALTVANLNVELIDINGFSVLATGASTGAGVPEVISAFDASTAGTYFVRVFQNSAVNNVQGYNISVTTAGNTTNFASADTPKAITDASTTTSTIVVPAAKTIDIITDVDVNIDISHTNVEDLDVTLESPTGTVVELFTDVGGTGNDFTSTVLDDDAGTAVTAGTAPFTGSFQPEGVLADYNGETAVGTWTLTITDDSAPTSGTLNSWSLDISGSTTPPPVPTSNRIALLLMALSLIGVALVARVPLRRKVNLR